MQVSREMVISYADDLALIKKVVHKAGQIAKAAFLKDELQIWDKGDGHLVTSADIEVNNYLSKYLKENRPNYGWLSEETKDDSSRLKANRTFVVDPIDGTKAFIDGTIDFVVSVAVIESNYPVAAVVYNPIKNEMFEATLGGGSKLNNSNIKVNDKKSVKGITMIGYSRKFKQLKWPHMNCFNVNSMAYRIALVACGKADATVAFTPKSDWDIAAAQLIATEAGAYISNINGKIPSYGNTNTKGSGIICAGKNLHSLLLDLTYPVIKRYNTSTDKLKEFGFMATKSEDRKNVQLLHIVIGGELLDPNKSEFKDLNKLDYIGAFPNFKSAHTAWKSAAQRTVDNAHMRYFILHAHELIDPNKDGIIG